MACEAHDLGMDDQPRNCPFCELRFATHNEVKDHIMHDHPDRADVAHDNFVVGRTEEAPPLVPAARLPERRYDAIRHEVQLVAKCRLSGLNTSSVTVPS